MWFRGAFMLGILVRGKISFHADLNSKSNIWTKISLITFFYVIVMGNFHGHFVHVQFYFGRCIVETWCQMER